MLRSQHASTLAALKAGKYTDEITSVLDKVAADTAASLAK
jgi:hypothetical protein